MYDLIIIGGGPAGLTAAIYAARYKLKTIVISDSFGGQAAKSFEVENYPGFESISGLDLMKKFESHAKKFGVEIKYSGVKSILKDEQGFSVGDLQARSILFATGTKTRKLGVDGEEKYSGRGVSYCATCDAAFFKDKIVAVVGGSDSAAESALLLTRYASKVYIIYRKGELRCEPITKDLVEKNDKIEIVYNANVTEIFGEEKMAEVKLDTGKGLECQGVFIEIGASPNSDLAKQLGIELDNSYIIVDKNMRTNIEKAYAAGDVTTASASFWQIITACSEGAIAARTAYNELQK